MPTMNRSSHATIEPSAFSAQHQHHPGSYAPPPAPTGMAMQYASRASAYSAPDPIASSHPSHPPHHPPPPPHPRTEYSHHSYPSLQQPRSLPPPTSRDDHPAAYPSATSSNDLSSFPQHHSRSYSSSHHAPYPESLHAQHPSRLHHSSSVGNMAASSTPYRASVTGVGAGTASLKQGATTTISGTVPKKKDPYATAWRTYSKIAEELDLLNPDGTLYPISKPAILKYLRHQSKRIKSSNLHWYVNGLKKHQENLGFPWDDVRYDDDVVALLKELTLHPVNPAQQQHGGGNGGNGGSSGGGGGGDDGHGGHGQRSRTHDHQYHQHHAQQQPQQSHHAQQHALHHQHHPQHHHRHHHQQPPQQQPQQQQQQQQHGYRPRQSSTSSGSYLPPHSYSSTNAPTTLSIETARIADLSISNKTHSSVHSNAQHPHRPPSHGSFPEHAYPSTAFGVGSKKYERAQDRGDLSPPSRMAAMSPPQSTYHQAPASSQNSPPARGTSYHSAPVSLPSHLAQTGATAEPTSANLHRNRSYSRAEGLVSSIGSTPPAPLSSTAGQARSPDMSTADPLMYSGLNAKRKREELGPRKNQLASPKSPLVDDYELGAVDEALPDRHRSAMHMDEEEDLDEESRNLHVLKRHVSTGTLRNQTKASSSSSVGNMAQETTTMMATQGKEFSTTPSPSARDPEGNEYRWGTSETTASMSLQSRLSPPGSISSIGSGSPVHRHQSAVSSGSHNGIPILGHRQQHSSRRGHGSNGIVSPGSNSTSSLMNSPPSLSSSSMTVTPASKNTVQFSEVVDCAQQLQTKYGKRCRDHPWGCVEISEDVHLELTIKMYMDWAGLVASGRLTMDDIPDLPEFRQGHLDSPQSQVAVAVNNGGPLKRTTSTPFSPLSSNSGYNNGTGGGEETSQTHPRRGSTLQSSPPYSPLFGHANARGQVTDSLMSRIGSPPPQTKIPSPPISSGSHHPHRGSTSSGSTARARARRILSSPSLGQHQSFRLEDDDGPPRPLPPLPPLPLNIPDRMPRKGRPPGSSTGTGVGTGSVTTRTNSAVSSPPSEIDSGPMMEDTKDSGENEEAMSMAIVEDTEMEVEVESHAHAHTEADQDEMDRYEEMVPSKGLPTRFGGDRGELVEDDEEREGADDEEDRRVGDRRGPRRYYDERDTSPGQERSWIDKDPGAEPRINRPSVAGNERRMRRQESMEAMYDSYDHDEARFGAGDQEEEEEEAMSGGQHEHHGRSYRLSSPDETRQHRDRY